MTSLNFALCACAGAVAREECHPLTAEQIASGSGGSTYEMPSAGVITSFSHVAGEEEGTSIRLAVYQKTLNPERFFTVGGWRSG